MNDNNIKISVKEFPELYRSGFKPFLTELSEVGFRNVKLKFVEKKATIYDIRRNRPVYNLLNALCAQDLLMILNKDNFARVLDCFFPTLRLWPYQIEDYVCELVAMIDVERVNEQIGGDAGKAFKHLIEMKKIFEICIKDLNLTDIIQYLVDIYKTVTCLNTINKNAEYRFQVNRLALEETDFCLQLRYDKLFRESMGFSLAGKREGVDMHSTPTLTQKKYISPLSWILTELICDQDGIDAETEEQDDE